PAGSRTARSPACSRCRSRTSARACIAPSRSSERHALSDVLTAIDEALDTGVAADDDPLTRELQELALMLRDDAPQATPEFRERMDGRVESGFQKPRGSPA